MKEKTVLKKTACACTILAALCLTAYAQAQYPQTMWIKVTFYDFHSDKSNPEFEQNHLTGVHQGMVGNTLNAQRNPVLGPSPRLNYGIDKWFVPWTPGDFVIPSYRTDATGIAYDGTSFYLGPKTVNYDTAFKNIVIVDSLPFNHLGGGLYQYLNQAFFMLDGKGFGNEGLPHNFSFTMAIHDTFTYQIGLTFSFEGDDDVWAYIDGRLVMDLGSLHGAAAGAFNVDDIPGLVVGARYAFDFFYAERHTVASDIKITTNLFGGLVLPPGPQLIPISSTSTELRPVFSWHSIPNSSTYTIQIDTVASFNAPMIMVPVSDTFFKPLVNLPADTIYWRVKGDSTAFSTAGFFIIGDVRIPVLIAYEPAITQVRRPLLQWHRVPGAAKYTVAADDNQNFSSPVFTLEVSDSFFQVLSDLPYGDIYWKVKSDLIDTWSSADQFTILSDTIPNLVRFNGNSVSLKRPLFIWGPVMNASDYKIEIANNRDFTNATSVTVADTTFKPLADLSNGMWFWHVSCSRNYALFAPVDSVKMDISGVVRRAGSVAPFISLTRSDRGFAISLGGYNRGEVIAVLYSVKGQLVARLKPSDFGQNSFVWDYKDNNGKRVSNGLYLLEIKAGAKIVKQRIIVTR
jgi:fibro-slime domain-containing protein